MATSVEELSVGEELSLRIREVRRIAGKTQAEFAATVGVSRSYLSEVEALKSKPSIEMILGIAAQFPTIAGASWFFLGTGTPGPYEQTLAPVGLDYDCVHHCLSLMERPAIRDAVSDNASVQARALYLLISVYVSSVQMVMLEKGSVDEARKEGRGRSAEIATSMEADPDEFIYRGHR